MRRIPRFVRLPRSAARIRSEVDEEIRFDVEMRAQELIRSGVAPDEALRRAAREFGDIDATRDYCAALDNEIEQTARRSNRLEDLRADLAIAWRGMRRTPLFAAVVVATLALGIGANTAIFSVVRRVLIAPLPFGVPEQLYRLYTRPAAVDGDDDKLSAVELRDLAAQSRSIDGLTMFGNYGSVTYTDDQSAESWATVSVDGKFFDVLGIRPVLGRTFTASDMVAGAPRVIMITYDVWQRTFGGDGRVLGRVVQLSAKPATIVGVLPEQFVGPTFAADALLPLDLESVFRNASVARSRAWRAIARLRAGVSVQQWHAELATLQPRIASAYPDIRNAGIVLPRQLHEAIVGGAGAVLRLLMAAALVVLLATCANIAGLFLARAPARRREFGVRAALGADRGRLVRQALTEALVYGIVGGAAGLLLAAVLKGSLLRAAGPMLPKLGDVRIDATVLSFAFVTALLSGVAFGAWPAAVATRIDVRDALGDGGGRGASRGASASRASRLLVSAQIAFAVVLMIGGGLLYRAFVTLAHADLGYETSRHQETFFLSLGRFPDLASRGAFVETFLDRVHALPGVTAVGYTVSGPWNGSWRGVSFRVEGRPDAGDPPRVILSTASSQYFAAVGIPMRLGRGFTSADRPASPRVVVISESTARRFWPNANPLGARLHLDLPTVNRADTALTYEVVGVAGDVRADAAADAMPTLYVSAEQAQIFGSAFVLRTRGDAESVLPALKDMARRLDSRVPLVSPRTLSDVRSEMIRRQDLAMKLIGLFAVLALVVAALGVYGIMSYSVVARTREFGIRSALGASPAGIVGIVLREGAVTSAIGIAAGLGMAAALSRVMVSLLAGVSAHDPVIFATVPIVLGCVALAASVLPALAAIRIEPTEALRLE